MAPKARHRPEPLEHPNLFVVGDYLFDSTINEVLDSAEFVADLIVDQIARNHQAAAIGNGTLHPASNALMPLLPPSTPHFPLYSRLPG